MLLIRQEFKKKKSLYVVFVFLPQAEPLNLDSSVLLENIFRLKREFCISVSTFLHCKRVN